MMGVPTFKKNINLQASYKLKTRPRIITDNILRFLEFYKPFRKI